MAKQSIKQLWNKVSGGGVASIEMAQQAIDAYWNHDGAIEKAQQVLTLSAEQPVYHEAFVSVLTACIAIDKKGERVKLQAKGLTKRENATAAFADAVKSEDYKNIIDLTRGKKDAAKPAKSTFAKIAGNLSTAATMIGKDDADGTPAELAMVLASAMAIVEAAQNLQKIALNLGIEDGVELADNVETADSEAAVG
jgi:putative sterol carrier protein